MLLSKNILLILIPVLLLQSCIEPFAPSTTDYEDMLIIEGYLTNHPQYEALVNISRTKPLDPELQDGNYFVTGATVSIESSDGTIFTLGDNGNGSYSASPGLIVPEVGKSYKLTVQTWEGDLFESDFQKFNPGTQIDSLTFSPGIKKESETDSAVEGLQFYANTTGVGDEPLYLRWIIDATYIYQVPLEANYIWYGRRVDFTNQDSITCWRSYDINGIFLGTSVGLAENRVANAKLNFVSQYGDFLTQKYSLHALQFSISESAYRFWYELNKTISETGGLYETLPFKINGNIRCVSNPDVSVTGVFEVASVTEKRIFAPRPREFAIIPQICPLDTLGTESYPWSDVYPGTYITEPVPGVFLTSSPDCFICTLRGGTIHRPSFWE